MRAGAAPPCRAAGLHAVGEGEALWSFGVSPPVPSAGARPVGAPVCYSSVSFPAWTPFCDECHACRLQLTVGYRRRVDGDDDRGSGRRQRQTSSGNVAFAIKFETRTSGGMLEEEVAACNLAVHVYAEDGAVVLTGRVVGRPQCLTHIGDVLVANVPTLPASRLLLVHLERLQDDAGTTEAPTR